MRSRVKDIEALLADIASIERNPTYGKPRAFRVIRARSGMRYWLIPGDSRTGARSGLDLFQPTTLTSKVAKLIARTAAGIGALRWIADDTLYLPIPRRLSAVFGEKLASIAGFSGTSGPHRKTTVQAMGPRGEILGYCKITREEHLRKYLSNEARTLREVCGLRLQTASTPNLLDFRDEKGSAFLATDTLKTDTHRVCTELEPAHERFLRELASRTRTRGCRDLLAALNKQAGSMSTPELSVWRERLCAAASELAPHADRIQLCRAHGDFTPWNSFFQDGRLYVFDWEYSNSAWPVGFDLMHFKVCTATEARRSDARRIIAEASEVHFAGNSQLAVKHLLLAAACHAALYLERLAEVGADLAAWPEQHVRASMMDALLSEARPVQ